MNVSIVFLFLILTLFFDFDFDVAFAPRGLIYIDEKNTQKNTLTFGLATINGAIHNHAHLPGNDFEWEGRSGMTTINFSPGAIDKFGSLRKCPTTDPACNASSGAISIVPPTPGPGEPGYDPNAPVNDGRIRVTTLGVYFH